MNNIKELKEKIDREIMKTHLDDDVLDYLVGGSLYKKDLIEICINETLSAVGKEIDGDKVYPKDIFSEVTKKQLSQINNYLEHTHGFSLDRLSAHIGRRVLNNIKSKLQIPTEKEQRRKGE
jgi:hypothetical protein